MAIKGLQLKVVTLADRTALDAFNNSVTSEDRWQTGPGNGAADYGENEWIKFDVGNNRNYIECYRIWARSGTNSNEALERAQSLPRDWRIEGSDDDVNWTILDTRTGINNDDIAHTSGGISSAPYKEYKMQNPGTYRYYRLWVLSTNSIHGLNISELAYYGREVRRRARILTSNIKKQLTYQALDKSISGITLEITLLPLLNVYQIETENA